MELKIKKCVLCGADPELREEYKNGKLTMYAKCSKCNNKSITQTMKTSDAHMREMTRSIIIASWNGLNNMNDTERMRNYAALGVETREYKGE